MWQTRPARRHDALQILQRDVAIALLRKLYKTKHGFATVQFFNHDHAGARGHDVLHVAGPRPKGGPGKDRVVFSQQPNQMHWMPRDDGQGGRAPRKAPHVLRHLRIGH
nr:unnamed protein product [Orgyia pseudotsugata single capsid nuclopolyhedrovirus]